MYKYNWSTAAKGLSWDKFPGTQTKMQHSGILANAPRLSEIVAATTVAAVLAVAEVAWVSV